MADFQFMNTPLNNEAEFAVSTLDRLLSRAKEDIKTTVGVAKDLISRKAWTDPDKNKRYTDLNLGAKEANQRAKKSLKDKSEANKAAEREKTAKDTTVRPVESRKPKVSGANPKTTAEILERYRKEARERLTEGKSPDLSRSEVDGTLLYDKRYKVGGKKKS